MPLTMSTTGTVHVHDELSLRTKCGHRIADTWTVHDPMTPLERDHYACSTCFWGGRIEEFGTIIGVCTVCDQEVKNVRWGRMRHRHIREASNE